MSADETAASRYGSGCMITTVTIDTAPPSDRRALVLDPADTVCVACTNLAVGAELVVDGERLVVSAAIALGHKLARRNIEAGETVLKYGAPIGVATRAIARGEHVHVHNLRSEYLPTYTLDGANPYVKDPA